MQLSLRADNRDALSSSFEEGDSASLCCYRPVPVHLQQQQQEQQDSSSWHVNCFEMRKVGNDKQPLNCVSHFMQDTLSCSSWPTSPGLRWEKRWVDLRLIPLLHSRLSQYIPGSDVCRWAVGTSSQRVGGSVLAGGAGVTLLHFKCLGVY